eukprot:TRINITY_DN24959_c0_g1_i1.p1 TRINITY_DN24959_c0_g1~~TRINITY_DN24959_c0_g1_i1.p1  ORF type:complete len:630 (-),score=41.69 TRINITY_DN24959_c0_g1_i1:1688-3577(-)
MKDQTFLVLYVMVATSFLLMSVDFVNIHSYDVSGYVGFSLDKVGKLLATNRGYLLLGYGASFFALTFATGMYRSVRAMKNFGPIHKFVACISFIAGIAFLYALYFLYNNQVFYPFAIVFYIFSTTYFLRIFSRFQKLEDKGEALSPEKSEITNERSFTLNCHEGGYLNIVNPFRGIGIYGSAGSGKTASLFFPIIEQAIAKHYTAIVFDYKYPNESKGQFSLINKVYYEFKKLRKKGSDMKFYYINYYEPLKSHRVNFLHPKYLDSVVRANEIAETLLLNLSGKTKGGDPFWHNNARALFTGLIWYLKKYFPQYCTLPHAILLVNNENFGDMIIKMGSDIEIAPIISSITTPMKVKAGNQLAGVISSLQTEFSKLLNHSIFWVHSGHDFDLDINNPEDPKWVVVASHQSIQKSLAPVISCVVSTSLGLMNQPGKEKSLAILDEGPTLFIPNIQQYPATARSNKVSMVYSAQDFSLMHEQLGKEMTEALNSNLNYQFVGKLGNLQTAEQYSKIIGKYDKAMKNISDGVNAGRDNVGTNQGVSYSHQERFLFPAEKFFDLDQGEFVLLSTESEKNKAKGRIKIDLSEQYTEVDIINPYATPQALKRNYERLYAEAEGILSGEIQITLRVTG